MRMDQFISIAPAVERLARQALPTLGDFAFVFLARGGTITCAAAAHITLAGEHLVRALARVYRVRRSDRDSTVAEAMRRGSAMRRTYIRSDDRPQLREGSIADLHRRLAPRSALGVPILAGKAVLGALSLGYSDSRRAYSAVDVAPATRLARRIARVLCPQKPRAFMRPSRQGRGTVPRRRAVLQT